MHHPALQIESVRSNLQPEGHNRPGWYSIICVIDKVINYVIIITEITCFHKKMRSDVSKSHFSLAKPIINDDVNS